GTSAWNRPRKHTARRFAKSTNYGGSRIKVDSTNCYLANATRVGSPNLPHQSLVKTRRSASPFPCHLYSLLHALAIMMPSPGAGPWGIWKDARVGDIVSHA